MNMFGAKVKQAKQFEEELKNTKVTCPHCKQTYTGIEA